MSPINIIENRRIKREVFDAAATAEYRAEVDANSTPELIAELREARRIAADEYRASLGE